MVTKDTLVANLDAALQLRDKDGLLDELQIINEVGKIVGEVIKYNYGKGVEAIMPKADYDKAFKEMGVREVDFFVDKKNLTSRILPAINEVLSEYVHTLKQTKAVRKDIVTVIVEYLYVYAQHALTTGKINARKIKKIVENKAYKDAKYTPKSLRGMVGKIMK